MTSKASTARLFVALAVPDEVKAALEEAQRELRRVLPPNAAAWTRPEGMHLTLRFLGNVEEARLPDVEGALCAAAHGFGALELLARGLGAFPGVRRPHVVWAGVDDAAGRLVRLHQRVNGAVAPFAEKPAEARFVGHVTLARPKRLRGPDAAGLARVLKSAADRRFGAWRATELELVESTLLGAGARTLTRARVALT